MSYVAPKKSKMINYEFNTILGLRYKRNYFSVRFFSKYCTYMVYYVS